MQLRISGMCMCKKYIVEFVQTHVAQGIILPQSNELLQNHLIDENDRVYQFLPKTYTCNQISSTHLAEISFFFH